MSTTWSLRNVARYGAVLLAGIVAGSKAVSAYVAFQQYREWRFVDPSGADAMLTFAQMDSVEAVLTLGIGWLVWFLLRPRPKKETDVM